MKSQTDSSIQIFSFNQNPNYQYSIFLFIFYQFKEFQKKKKKTKHLFYYFFQTTEMNELKIIKSIVSWILFVAFLFVVPWSSLFFYLRSKLFQWEKQKNKLLQNSTNDCLYFVTTPDGWRIALTHYPPSNSTSSSNSNKHKKFPVLLCHGLSANRITFDMGPEPFPSLARYLSDQVNFPHIFFTV